MMIWLNSHLMLVKTETIYGNPQYLRTCWKCLREKGKTIYDIWADPINVKLIEQTKIKNLYGRTAAGNVYEAFSLTQAVPCLRQPPNMYLKYGATLLDPTVGWGRMLGAWALGIDYTGVDTNTNMKIAYDNMMDMLDEYNNMGSLFEVENCNPECTGKTVLQLITVKLNMTLHNVSHINMELYEHMSPWKDKDDFYDNFPRSLCVTLDNMKLVKSLLEY